LVRIRGVDFAVARVDDLAVLVSQALPLHAANEREAEDRVIPAVVGTLGAARIAFLTGSWKHLRDRALEDAVMVHEQEPADGPAVLNFLPESGHRLGCCMHRDTRHKAECGETTQQHR
jgi:hypothetical protein